MHNSVLVKENIKERVGKNLSFYVMYCSNRSNNYSPANPDHDCLRIATEGTATVAMLLICPERLIDPVLVFDPAAALKYIDEPGT